MSLNTLFFWVNITLSLIFSIIGNTNGALFALIWAIIFQNRMYNE